MDKKKILVNIFSNWTNFAVGILVAFFVSPIIVHSLGNEKYGIWTLIVSLTGYFTVLDFGVNSAIVRYISKYTATKEYDKANKIYSTAFIFFIIVAVFVLIITAVFAYFFKDFFNIQFLTRKYLYFLFFIVGTDLAFNFVFSVYQATLRGLQDFLKVNIISIATLLIRNALIVILLFQGYSLVSLAFVQLAVHIFRAFLQYTVIRKNYVFLSYQSRHYDKTVLKQIYQYSIYSFIISIAIKVLFFTDSVVIGKLLDVSEVTFYAIPAMLLQYSEKFVYAIVAVLVPVISSNEALGDKNKIRDIYMLGSRYSLLLSVPMLFIFYTNGANFISIWMGNEYGIRADKVLKILVIGYAFSLPQMIAQGILKGISKHKAFAYILIVEAVANLVISIILVRSHGIEGVAVGTTLPLIVVNIFVVPAYTCYLLKVNLFNYFYRSYSGPIIALMVLIALQSYFRFKVLSYLEFGVFALAVLLAMTILSFCFIIDREHKALIWGLIQKKLFKF